MNEPILTVCIPCFARPQRTLRIINQLLEQDINGWEAYIIGDGCPDFQRLLDSGLFDELQKSSKANENQLIFRNLPIHRGGWGYEIRNKVKELARGKYLIYIDNDDCIAPDHISHYYNEIVNTDYDFVFFDSYIQAIQKIRSTELAFGAIGHAELIIKTAFLKTLPPHTPEYGHDWKLITNMIKLGAKYKKSDSGKATYHILGVGDFRETQID
jgi:glycosyltransferase involved in cell wall biosynthesis